MFSSCPITVSPRYWPRDRVHTRSRASGPLADRAGARRGQAENPGPLGSLGLAACAAGAVAAKVSARVFEPPRACSRREHTANTTMTHRRAGPVPADRSGSPLFGGAGKRPPMRPDRRSSGRPGCRELHGQAGAISRAAHPAWPRARRDCEALGASRGGQPPRTRSRKKERTANGPTTHRPAKPVPSDDATCGGSSSSPTVGAAISRTGSHELGRVPWMLVDAGHALGKRGDQAGDRPAFQPSIRPVSRKTSCADGRAPRRMTGHTTSRA